MKSKDVEEVRLWELCKNSPVVSDDDDFVELQRHIGQFVLQQNILIASAPAELDYS